MNILFLSTNDTLGGAATVTLRLVEALRDKGVEARMLVGRKDTHLPFVRRVNPLTRMGAKVAERIQILCANGFSRRGMWKLSTAAFGADPTSDPWVREADVIVLGWINQGLLSLRGIRRLAAMGNPLMWWMHDYWCATGICHLPGSCDHFQSGCGSCPFLNGRGGADDLSRRIFMEKERTYRLSGVPPLRFLAVSTYQRDIIARSALARVMGPVEVLPHAFPARLYHTSPSLHPFPALEGKKLIVAGAANLLDPMKNMEGAVNALNLLSDLHPEVADHCHAVFFGGASDPSLFSRLRFPATLAGPMSAEHLRQLYAASAVVLSPSLSETMGATLMEGIAAGAVGVSYDSGGPRDIIKEGENGFIVPVGDEEALARAIARALDIENRQGADGRRRRHGSIADRFDSRAIADRFISLIP